MQTITLKPFCLLLISALFFGCSSPGKKQPAEETANIATPAGLSAADSLAEFERKMYLHIDEIHSGKVYTNKLGKGVFYRLLIVPDEENVTLLAENIEIGEEGGNFKLIKMLRLTDDNSVLPKFGLASADSVQFIDSVNIRGYFNHQKMIINLDKLKPYHPSY